MIWDRDAVKQLRKALELTQDEFADLLGCRQQTISEWEQGLYAPANAYGKLLTQLKSRSPSFEIPQRQSVLKTQFFNENEYTSQSDRPFDPAID